MYKYLLGILVVLFGSLSAVSFAAPSFSTTVFPWLSQQGLTKYTAEADFRGGDKITRGEAAKFFTMYAEAIKMPIVEDTDSTKCVFTDITTYDTTLTPFITKACSYGLMKGSNGKFMPNDTLTEVQAITVAVRSLDGYLDETMTPRYNEYMGHASDLGLLTVVENPEKSNTMNATRSQVGSMLFIANKRSQERKLSIKPSMMANDGCVWEEVTLKAKNVKMLAQNCSFDGGSKMAFEANEMLPGFTSVSTASDGTKTSFNAVEFINTQGTTTSGPVDQLESWLDKTYATIDARNPEPDTTGLTPDMAALAKTDHKTYVDRLKANGVLGECNLVKMDGDMPAGIERYQYTPSTDYKGKIDSVASVQGLEAARMSACGPYGLTNGHQYFQIDTAHPESPIFVRVGVDLPYFDVNSLTFIK